MCSCGVLIDRRRTQETLAATDVLNSFLWNFLISRILEMLTDSTENTVRPSIPLHSDFQRIWSLVKKLSMACVICDQNKLLPFGTSHGIEYSDGWNLLRCICIALQTRHLSATRNLSAASALVRYSILSKCTKPGISKAYGLIRVFVYSWGKKVKVKTTWT